MKKISIQKMSPEELKIKGVSSWPIWTKEVSRFDWTYAGKEECYIIEGEFFVETDEGTVQIKPGDFVIFSDGLKCSWDIKSPVKKYYNFP
ncbi:MAG: cupin [Bacteroidetes bacterium]|nr:MAG: cupin [Bacteroidota bacterium]